MISDAELLAITTVDIMEYARKYCAVMQIPDTEIENAMGPMGRSQELATELLKFREEKRQAEEARTASSAVYEHYKGGHYNYIGVAKQESDGTLLALYRSVDTQTIFARPASEFFSEVKIHGVSVPRFRVL